jgi:hypothetical protein
MSSKDELKDMLNQLYSLAKGQREAVKRGAAEEIEKLACQKKEKLNLANDCLSQVKSHMKALWSSGNADDRLAAQDFLAVFKRDIDPLIEGIRIIELEDIDFLQGEKETVAIELQEIEQAYSILKLIKRNYAGQNKQPVVFDQKG